MFSVLKSRVVAAVTAALVAVLLAPAGVASAGTVDISDGTADTWQTFYDFNLPDPATYEPSGSTRNVDVTRTTVSYTRSQIKVVVHYAELEQDDAYMPGFRNWFRLAGGGAAMLNPYVWDSWSGPEMFFWKPRLDVPRTSRLRGGCSTATARFDLARDTLTSKIPATCLGNPAWIQFHGKADSGHHDEDGVWTTSFQDNVHTATAEDRLTGVSQACFSQCEGWTGKIRPSKKG